MQTVGAQLCAGQLVAIWFLHSLTVIGYLITFVFIGGSVGPIRNLVPTHSLRNVVLGDAGRFSRFKRAELYLQASCLQDDLMEVSVMQLHVFMF